MDSRWFLICGTVPLLLAGCATPRPVMPSGAAAHDLFPAPQPNSQLANYRIGPQDVLRVTVFQEKDLSSDEVPVDASGQIVLPLIGIVEAAGQTPLELSQNIARAYDRRYLNNSQVSIVVVKAASQKVTVEGAVMDPGIYPIEGQTTLLQAMALSNGPTETAKTDEVIIFRQKPDGLYAARFDLAQIRVGLQPNPEIFGNDIVVVGNSYAKQIFRDFVQMSPLLASVFVRVK